MKVRGTRRDHHFREILRQFVRFEHFYLTAGSTSRSNWSVKYDVRIALFFQGSPPAGWQCPRKASQQAIVEGIDSEWHFQNTANKKGPATWNTVVQTNSRDIVCVQAQSLCQFHDFPHIGSLCCTTSITQRDDPVSNVEFSTPNPVPVVPRRGYWH